MRRVGITVVVLGLLVATTVAFGITEALKLERSPITRIRFDRVLSPVCGCRHDTARLSFHLRHAETLDASVVDADGDSVRRLAESSRREGGPVVLRWDGRTDNGEVVPDGAYRLRVHLGEEHRTIVVPNRVRVDTEAPAATLVRLTPRRLSPDGDGVRDEASIAFRLSEPGRVLVLVDGRVAVREGRRRAGAAELAWAGTSERGPLQAGQHAVTLEAEDRAGNISAPTPEMRVLIRYLELADGRLRARRGGVLRFRVLADAPRIRWTLSARQGEERRPVLRGAAAPGPISARLPLRIRVGRYVLRVAASGHHDQAVVAIRAML